MSGSGFESSSTSLEEPAYVACRKPSEAAAIERVSRFLLKERIVPSNLRLPVAISQARLFCHPSPVHPFNQRLSTTNTHKPNAFRPSQRPRSISSFDCNVTLHYAAHHIQVSESLCFLLNQWQGALLVLHCRPIPPLYSTVALAPTTPPIVRCYSRFNYSYSAQICRNTTQGRWLNATA